MSEELPLSNEERFNQLQTRIEELNQRLGVEEIRSEARLRSTNERIDHLENAQSQTERIQATEIVRTTEHFEGIRAAINQQHVELQSQLTRFDGRQAEVMTKLENVESKQDASHQLQLTTLERMRNGEDRLELLEGKVDEILRLLQQRGTP
jgi:hypothetical protein